jgi:hypothetical protein
MQSIILFLQIGELFKGNLNWRGVLHLVTFIVMGLIVVGLSAFFIRIVLKSRRKNDD